MTTAAPAPSPASAPYRLSREHRRVFVGLMLGMLVASVSQTIVGPAMPRIVAELGGMEHYSWVATAAMLVSAVSVPIIGKLSDLYGRRRFYLGGIVVFMVGSLVCGFASSFWTLVAGRAIQGLGMGTLMPLSQTIIGDIIPPRQRGKYQGLMGAVFGVTSVAGPLAGGFITDHWGWRWLFFVALPVGAVAFVVIGRFLHLEHVRREVSIDYLGMATLATSLTALLLATSLGGTQWAWGSVQSISLYVIGALALVAFVLVEGRAAEPVLPLRLFGSRVFTLSNVAAFGVSMVMFGAIIYIPVFAQGVIGVDATNSGLILMPLMLGMIGLGIITDYRNMSAYAGSALKFHMRTTTASTFKIGINTSFGDSWVDFVDGGQNYGLARDGQWHAVTIPFSAFYDLDLHAVKQMFMVVADPPAQDVELFIDNVYYQSP